MSHPPQYPGIPPSSGNPPFNPPPPGVQPPILPDQSADPAVYATGNKPHHHPNHAQYPSGVEGYISSPAGYPPPPAPHGYGQPHQYYPSQPGQMPTSMSPYGPEHGPYGPGTNVMGFPAVIQDGTYSMEERARERTGTCIGYFTLFFGFIFPIFWIIGSFLPCCYPRSKRVQCLACTNSILFIITAVLVIVLPVTMRDNGNNNNYNGNNGRVINT